MKSLLSILVVLVLSISVTAQNVPSPETYLGYKVGTRYTRHHKIVEYFNTVAKARPDMVKIESYGQTNEGRELMLAFVSSPENMQRLEAIRLNNLRLAGTTKDRAAPIVENAPAIVWLSYNVHGNEPSSSEAALLMIHALVDPANSTTKEWLKNTVVVIDPCINPDGRDRYVNWFNSVVGKEMNAEPSSREHAEPWPGGRSNHYNFDLNRDWAWQTQVETQQRLKKYNAWLPQVHVDFHEQGYNEPYYFAPAAEPFHEVITPWQRDFQVLIGRNNASYFDKNGWLFFTKERFDLLYPSYGDTYPVYNGAIGMTYEQGGHSRGGLAVVNEDGDTLTLVDRATHHFTTGLSTVETASKHQQKLMNEFKKYFDDSRAGKIGEYKTYVLTSKDQNKLNAVIKLLDQNGIEWGTVSNKNFSGFNYFTGKQEAFADEGLHIAVSAAQPKAVLAKVLLEPRTVVTDSNTYDITTWSVPYAYGVKGYAVKEKLEVSNDWKSTPVAPVIASYGLLIPYTSFNSAKVLAELLKQNVKVRFAEKPFKYGAKNYERGTLVVLKTSNSSVNWAAITNAACIKHNVQADVVETGFMDQGSDMGSPDVKMISSAPKVALLTGEGTSSLGAGEVWHFFDKQLDYPLTLINANDLGRANLKNFNVLIVPDGFIRALSEKVTSDRLKDFVRSGGKIVALENAVSLMASEWGLKQKTDKDDEKGEYLDVKKYGDRERSYLPNSIPGAIYKMDLDNTHPLGFGYPDFYYTLKQDATLYEFMKGGWNVGVLKKDAYVTGFAGYKVKSKLKDGMLFGVQDMGGGSVVYLSDNPLFRNFWENGKLLFSNAVFLAGQ
ncbi:MAG: M14 metallopeptidase family protein [Sediminibacterium sp.]|uniref:M14 metallopeptidase family protein n=1 Tax=Sediminibacterium sp. TaxID=1917865 RepID=UPI002ABC7879|nr:M14 metallopeptidase family protein [Sediminibacterium sp.]MDZ4071262.1 M14 metallopeptidase family protein [Sediminibacterium sp.]